MSLSARFANRSILAATFAVATAGAYAVTAQADGPNGRTGSSSSSSSSSSQSQSSSTRGSSATSQSSQPSSASSQQTGQRGGGPGTSSATTTPPPSTTTPPGQMPAPPRQDGEIAQVVISINEGEVAEGRLASTRASDARVRQFATLMVRDHTNATQQLRQVLRQAQLTAQPSEMSRFLTAHAQQELGTLRTQRGPAFDQAYVTAQLQGHQQALQLLGQMIPTVTNPTLRQALETNVRPTVQMHLQHVQTLQSQLQQGGVQPSAASPGASPSSPGASPSGMQHGGMQH